ncbi:transmembrane protein, putative [Medicago truncatula]|uniref:Transmembrane protein, putative n=1 Tax=Medicago truncatula TaxID=3880 RepID=G7IRE9_MEDTR|nr:transmembrane protein, putative [Medicago truncatula]
MLPLKRKLLLGCIVVAGFSANGSILLVPPLLLYVQTDRLASIVPFVERGSDTTVGHTTTT